MDAVEALHQNRPKLIHRDINPNNLLRLPDGRWVLADFGLAKFLLELSEQAALDGRGASAYGFG